MLVSPQHLQAEDCITSGAPTPTGRRLPFSWAWPRSDRSSRGREQVKLSSSWRVARRLHLSFDGGDPSARRRGRSRAFPRPPRRRSTSTWPRSRADGVPSLITDSAFHPDGGRSAQRAHALQTDVRSVTDLSGTAEIWRPPSPIVTWCCCSERARTTSHIKVAEIVRETTGRLVVNETYIPPVSAHRGLAVIMESGAVRWDSWRPSNVSLRRSPPARSATVEFNAREHHPLLQLNTCNSAVPVLTDSRARRSERQGVYLYLVEWAGNWPPRRRPRDPHVRFRLHRPAQTSRKCSRR